MTEPTGSKAPQTNAPPPAARASNLKKTLLFFVALAAVVGVLAYLSALDPPPDMPSDEVHRLRFNTQGDLVGLASEDPGREVVEHTGLALDKKQIKARINQACASCHGAPELDLSSHPCRQGGRCISETHPPKNSCIECHRSAPR